MDNMEEDDHSSSSEEEEVEWYDYLVRRPNDADLQQRSEEQLPAPTKVFTSTYPQAGRDKDDIKLVLKGFQGDSDQAMLSSGLTEWDASDVLCNYLITNNTGKIDNGYKNKRLLELGSGLGKCGLLAYYLLLAKYGTNAFTVLTDGDKNVMPLLRKNVEVNTSSDDDNISCQQLKWGKEEAQSFLSQHDYEQFDLIIGSDLLYTNRRNMQPLIQTVYELLDKRGRFILAHNDEHSIPLDWIKMSAAGSDLFCEVLQQKGSISLLCFRRLGLSRVTRNQKVWHETSALVPVITKVTDVVGRLCTKNTTLEAENRALKARLELFEDRSLKLDARCTMLSGDKSLPKSIILSFDEDNLVSILSYLEPIDFASLASTCKRFGIKTHQIGDVHVSLMEKIAYKVYEGASPWEKEVLPTYRVDDSPFFSYNALIKLRKPIKFDQLFGYIEHAGGDKSIIQPLSMQGRMKVAPPTARGRSFPAFTAVSDHVMRAGKHYVTFTCTDIGLQSDQPLWFGVVRPLNRITPTGSLFTPFCGIWVNELRELQCQEWGDSNIHSCVYKARDGQCQSTDWGFNNNENEDNLPIPNVTNEDWHGMHSFVMNGKIGLLLDYDEGTLTVYKNDIKLGVMKEGLSGAYCWMVTVGMGWGKSWETSNKKARIEIERGSLPEDEKVLQEKRPRLL